MKKKLREKFSKLRVKKYFELNSNYEGFIYKKIITLCKKNKIKNIGIYYPINFELNIINIANKLKKETCIYSFNPYNARFFRK